MAVDVLGPDGQDCVDYLLLQIRWPLGDLGPEFFEFAWHGVSLEEDLIGGIEKLFHRDDGLFNRYGQLIEWNVRSWMQPLHLAIDFEP